MSPIDQEFIGEVFGPEFMDQVKTEDASAIQMACMRDPEGAKKHHLTRQDLRAKVDNVRHLRGADMINRLKWVFSSATISANMILTDLRVPRT